MPLYQQLLEILREEIVSGMKRQHLNVEATFNDVIDSRRFRRESWFLEPVGHINLCNVPLPVRVRS